MASGQTILILGGGIAGVVLARRLRRRLGKKHRVALVEKKPQHEYPPGYNRLALDVSPLVAMRIAYLRNRGIDVVHSEVLKIDPTNRQVRVTIRELGFDHLVIALGADLGTETVSGWGRNAHHTYSADEADRLRRDLKDFKGGTVVIGTAALPYKCPPAPYEFAFLFEEYCRKKGLREATTFHLFSPEPEPLAFAGESVSGALKGWLEERHITYHPESKLTGISGPTHEITFEGEKKLNYDFLYAVPPHRAPQVCVDSQLTGESGWISVNPETLETKWDGVYAIGDVAEVISSNGRRVPMTGAFAMKQADVVSKNLVAKIEGRTPPAAFDGKAGCELMVGGGRAAQIEADIFSGSGTFKMSSPSYLTQWKKLRREKMWVWDWFE